MRIAVIGAGSSGLITLKYLLDSFPAAQIACFEKSHSLRGCWGNQRPDFVSTSTKYTTQFSCFRQYLPELDAAQQFKEFYRGAEFGDYLEAFATHYMLKKHILFGVELRHLEWCDGQWRLLLAEGEAEQRQTFDAVFLCTGLASQRVTVDSAVIPIADDPEALRNKTIVVVGGGESAADIANYLAKADYHNTVFLSLRSGIRVSPRYHPIRGVPSDFLRSRLLLSFDKAVRNWVGEHFVSFRIRFDRLLAACFPHAHASTKPDQQVQALRREWDLKLKARAKGGLFNVFHTKSDTFLDAVAERRIHIIGPPVDRRWIDYFDFEQSSRLHVMPDMLVLSTGYRSRLADISGAKIALKDFYQGCVHTTMPNLFLIGFTRPIIGNIPSISEMQARYTVGILAGIYRLPAALPEKQRQAWAALCAEYPAINTQNVYPVEQFRYCDMLAGEMQIMPSLSTVGSLKTWLKIMCSTASTTHYIDRYFDRHELDQQKVYTPTLLLALLIVMRILGLPVRALKRVFRALYEEFK